MSAKIPSSIAVKIVATFAIAALSLSAQATRYWHGTESRALFSDTENWSDASGGSTGFSVPDSTTGDTTFRASKLANNNKTVFDKAYTVGANVYIETETSRSAPFIWSATDASYGLTTTADGWKFGRYADKAPAWLRIESGTYSAPYLRLGITANEEVGLILKDGLVSADIVRMAEADSINATLIIDGGVFTSKTELAYKSMANATNIIEVNGGKVSLAKFLLGGRSSKTAYDVANCYNRLEVNGGTMEWTGESGIGYATGSGSFAEMVVNEGATVNCNYGYFYVGDSGPGALTINGGTFTMANSDNGGLTLGHHKTGKDVGTLTMNGGVLTTKRFRLDYVQPGTKAVFNGGTLKPTATTTSFINADDNLTCEIGPGGLIIDTAGFDVTITHQFVGPDGIAATGSADIGTITKKGNGKLTLSSAFPAEKIIVEKGTVSANGTTYEVVPDETQNESRYWLGATQGALASESANWAASAGGEGGATAPVENFFGEVHFQGPFVNSSTVFDSAIELANYVFVDSGETPLVWSATDASYGLDFPNADWVLGSNSVTSLEIDSGTYSSKYFRLGYSEGAKADFLLDGGSVTAKSGRVVARLSTFASTANFFLGVTPRDGVVCRESSRIASRNAV